MLLVPTQAIPAQTFQIPLGGQLTQLSIYQEDTGVYMDVGIVNQTTPIIVGVLCQNLNRIVRSLYLGFIGDFAWVDTQGENDPEFLGLGSRYQLLYLEAADLPAGQG